MRGDAWLSHEPKAECGSHFTNNYMRETLGYVTRCSGSHRCLSANPFAAPLPFTWHAPR